jgi:formylglycine-generating enzyme required for sulfatase activity
MNRSGGGYPSRWLSRLAMVGICAVACTDRPSLAPFPEALIVVDTNLPVPLVVGRLRVDLYAEDGTWFDSADVARATPADWPASFSVYTDDESREKRVWVRLRAYPEGRQTDYRGERFRDWDAPFDEPLGNGQPRLVQAGIDVTPSTEPLHLLTVDRLVLVRLRPGQRGRVRVLLDGACAGTMSRMGPAGLPTTDGAATCASSYKSRVPVTESPSEPDMSLPTGTVVGTWMADSCAPGDAPDGGARICVDGGATLFGTTSITDYAPGAVQSVDSAPARVFALSRFVLDKEEVSVARYRDALVRGYRGLSPTVNNGPLLPYDPATSDNLSCTWSTQPMEREAYALNCMSWKAARAFCAFEGGDLPSEIQWEHAATVAGRLVKTRYPWGDQEPACDQAVFGRASLFYPRIPCDAQGDGVQPLSASAKDVSAIGVLEQGGNLHEWMLDDGISLTSPCWRDAPLLDPVCSSVDQASHILRGASWLSEGLRSTYRGAPKNQLPKSSTGFRCAYKVRQGP